ncbi:UDP-galactopyranose mutase [Flavobacterium micromati]|nr:UDP-galactopyranose mutase [Flavobacterium micromati]
MIQYDYLIVGSGLFGSVCARELTDAGFKCLVIEKRNHIGGNVYTESIEGINVHKYGAHIFHTDDKNIWNYVNKYAEFNRYTNSPLGLHKNKLYNLPFNMNTFYQLWGVSKPSEAREIIEKQIKEFGFKNPKNLEEQAISLVGKDIYEIFIKGYTEKQWGRSALDLPAFIIKRLPLRFTYDNNYFSDKYQGIPIGGYTPMIENMLKGIEVKTNVDFLSDKKQWIKQTKNIVYTGALDAFYNYQFGVLEYRSLDFNNESINIENYQGNAVVNYLDKNVPYTRIIEHKHFEFGNQKSTYITKEYPKEWQMGDERYYPINDDKNSVLSKLYKDLALKEKSVFFGGRLAEYRYYDMHQVIASALSLVKKLSNDD